MKRKYKIRLFVLILCLVGTYNLLLEFTNNANSHKEVKEVKEVNEVNEIKKEAKKELTNISLVIQDFKNIHDKAKIKANKDGNKLIVQITQGRNENGLKADFVNIIQYTDWCLGNIKNDIKTLDISVSLPDSEIKANLEMEMLICPENKPGYDMIPYFDENYVKGCIEND